MNKAATTLHPVAISQVIVNFAASYGVDIETCLLGTGVSELVLFDADALITPAQEMKLIENLILALPNSPAIGFELGLQYSVSTFGLWGFSLRTSRNLREMAQQALRYLPLSTAYCRFSINRDELGFAIYADASPISQHLRQFLLERDMATALNLLQELGLAGIDVQALEFQGAPPEHAARIAELCGITPRYHCEHNALRVRAEDAERPLPMYDVRLVRMLEDQCRAQLARRQIAGVAGQVRAQLLGPLGLSVSLEEVAEQLALSPRSLRRKLEEEKTSFRSIIEIERKMLAEQLLLSTQMKLDELALHLGYTDTASFTRAFRRWFGQSPGQYRNQQQS